MKRFHLPVPTGTLRSGGRVSMFVCCSTGVVPYFPEKIFVFSIFASVTESWKTKPESFFTYSAVFSVLQNENFEIVELVNFLCSVDR